MDRAGQFAGFKKLTSLKVFTKAKVRLAAQLKSVDAMVVFTGKTSHSMKNMAISTAKSKHIPVVMCRSCGVYNLRECLGRLVRQLPVNWRKLKKERPFGLCILGKIKGLSLSEIQKQYNDRGDRICHL